MTDIDLSLLNDFIVEAREHLDEMESHLLQLASEPQNTAILDSIFTNIHTIKGASQFVGLNKVSALAHKVEDLLDLLRKAELETNDAIIELLIEARDRLLILIVELEASQSENAAIDDLLANLENWLDTDTTHMPDEEDVEAKDNAIDTDLFQDLLPQTREYLAEIDANISQLELTPADNTIINNLLNNLRVISGTAEFIGLQQTLQLTKQTALFLEKIEQAHTSISGDQITLLFECKERLQLLLTEVEQFQLEATPVDDLIKLFDTDVVAEITANSNVSAITETDTTITDNATAILATETISDNSTQIDLELLQDFITEASEHLLAMETNILALEDSSNSEDTLNSIFTNMHTIKGAAQFVGLEITSLLSHKTEDLLDLLRCNGNLLNNNTIELLMLVRDRLTQLTDDLTQSQSEQTDVDDLLQQLDTAIQMAEGTVTDPVEISVPPNEVEDEIETSLTNQRGFDLSSEDYQEEYDQELLDIFLNQLHEKVSLIYQRIQTLSTSVQVLIDLEEITDNITALISSANYMGYEQLTQFYQSWLEQLQDEAKTYQESQQLNSDFNSHYLEQLFNAFPQLNQVVEGTDPETEITDISAQAANATPDEITANTATAESTAEPVISDDLFDQLSQALDQTLEHATDANPDKLHAMFDEMLSTPAPTPTPTPTPTSPATTKPVVAKKSAATITTPEKTPSTKTITNETPPTKTKAPIKAKQAPVETTSKTNEQIFKKSIRVDANKIDTLMNQVGELIVDRGFFHQLFNELRGLQQHLKDEVGLPPKELKKIRAFSFRFAEAIVALGRTSNELQEGVMKVRMLPIAQLFNRYPRLIHDLIHNTNKKVKLETRGEDTELDKMIIEEISDPLIHIIRNAIDHGIESVEERLSLGKPESATVLLEAYHESNHIVIEISDDGRGISTDHIKQKAIANGLYREEELARMSTREITQLILMPGFSTAQQVSKTSGRGVGMDVVKKNIEKLNGILDITSKPGNGTKFSLKIPLTLAIIRALQVRAGDHFFTIPLSNVEETLRVNQEETSTLEGTKVIHLRGKTLPIFWLSSLFNIEMDREETEKFFVIVVNTGIQQIGLVVDELMNQEEVVIKPMVDYLQESTGFSGATIIGDGQISLILDIYQLVNMTVNRQVRRHQQQDTNRKQEAKRPTSSTGSFS